MSTDHRHQRDEYLKSGKKQVFYHVERDGIKKAAHNDSKEVAFSDKYKNAFQKQKSKTEKTSLHFKSKSKIQSVKSSKAFGFQSHTQRTFGNKKSVSEVERSSDLKQTNAQTLSFKGKQASKKKISNVISTNSAENSVLNRDFVKGIKKQGEKAVIDFWMEQLDENESSEGAKNFKKAQEKANSTYKTSQKVKGFVTKHEKFGQSVNHQLKQDLRFQTKTTSLKPSKIERGANSNSLIKPNRPASFGKALVQKFTNKIQSMMVAMMNKPLVVVGGFSFALGVIFLALIAIFFPSIMNSNSHQAETYGVTYVKHWSEDGDAYHSDYLAQRYGITAEQIDGFIKSQGFTGLDSRASGTEFLKLQSESNIDVRMLVAFAQMESSYGTAGVAKEYPKSNLFGYGAVDSDPDQGAAWNNDRAVTDFKETQYDKYSNTSLYIMDLRAAAYHAGTLKQEKRFIGQLLILVNNVLKSQKHLINILMSMVEHHHLQMVMGLLVEGVEVLIFKF
ncbi:hypothetical protein ACN9TB_00875 [Lactococcus lactis]